MKNRAFDHRHYTDWRRPEDLVPYEKNAKIHDEKQIRNLVTSLKRMLAQLRQYDLFQAACTAEGGVNGKG